MRQLNDAVDILFEQPDIEMSTSEPMDTQINPVTPVEGKKAKKIWKEEEEKRFLAHLLKQGGKMALAPSNLYRQRFQQELMMEFNLKTKDQIRNKIDEGFKGKRQIWIQYSRKVGSF